VYQQALAWADAIKVNNTLVQLDLSDNPMIGEIGKAALAEAIQVCLYVV
jgi:hypothetical protein